MDVTGLDRRELQTRLRIIEEVMRATAEGVLDLQMKLDRLAVTRSNLQEELQSIETPA